MFRHGRPSLATPLASKKITTVSASTIRLRVVGWSPSRMRALNGRMTSPMNIARHGSVFEASGRPIRLH
jgi:hypothetical protein